MGFYHRMAPHARCVMQIKRRLEQNRDAARKSRARKKEYYKLLELEVRTLPQTLVLCVVPYSWDPRSQPCRAKGWNPCTSSWPETEGTQEQCTPVLKSTPLLGSRHTFNASHRCGAILRSTHS